MLRSFAILSLAALTACTSKPSARDERSPHGNGLIDGNGGGGGPSYRTNPWFLGDQPVSYCVRRAEDFNVDETTLRTLVAEALQSWTAVVNQMVDEPQGYTYATNYVLSDACSDATELVFAFGAADASMRQALKYNSKNLVGLSALMSYDLAALRGRGQVYIAPDAGPDAYTAKDLAPGFWGNHDKLFDVLLHEVGHVMGFQHDTTSFMIEGFPGFRLASDRPGRLSANMLLVRHKLDDTGLDLCGKFWFRNGNGDFLKEFEGTKICLDDSDFSSSLTLTPVSGAPVKYAVTTGSSDYSTLVNPLITATGDVSLASYTRSYSLRGSLVRGDETLPMTVELGSEGFSLHVFDTKTASWAEIVTLSDDLAVLNDVAKETSQ